MAFMKKKIIEYPCQWDYRVIGADAVALQVAVAECLGGCSYSCVPANRSSSGKYCSVAVEAVVPDEKTRDRIYKSLGKHAAVKMVL
jgi:uncharacterized protein